MLLVASKICFTSSLDKISLRELKSWDAIAKFPPTEINKEEKPNSEDEFESNNSLS